MNVTTKVKVQELIILVMEMLQQAYDLQSRGEQNGAEIDNLKLILQHLKSI